MRTMLIGFILALPLAAQEKKPEANPELIVLLTQIAEAKEKSKPVMAYAAKAIRLRNEQGANEEILLLIEDLAKVQAKEVLVPDAVPYLEQAEKFTKARRLTEAELLLDIAEPLYTEPLAEAKKQQDRYGAMIFAEDFRRITELRSQIGKAEKTLSSYNRLLEALRHRNFSNRWVSGGSSAEEKQKTEDEIKKVRETIAALESEISSRPKK